MKKTRTKSKVREIKTHQFRKSHIKNNKKTNGKIEVKPKIGRTLMHLIKMNSIKMKPIHPKIFKLGTQSKFYYPKNIKMQEP